MIDEAGESAFRALYRGRKFTLAETTVELPDGSSATREVVLHPGAVAIVPVHADGRVVLIRNRRFTVGVTLIEIPAGTLDQPGEEPDACAGRELREETGYRARRWRRLAEFYSTPGMTTERMFLYEATELESGPQNLQGDERIELLEVPWAEALAMCCDGRIQDAKTLIGLLLRDRLVAGGRG